MNDSTQLTYEVFLEKTHREADNTYTFTFSKPADFEWDEGTSIQLASSQYDFNNSGSVQEHNRHLSIVSMPCENHIAFTTRITEQASPFKQYLLCAKPGERFLMIDPVSKMALKRQGRPIILISAGVAISTMRPLIRSFAMDQNGIDSLRHINIDSSGDYIYQEEINTLEEMTKSFSNHYLDRRESFYRVLNDHFDKTAIYYITGSDQFIIDLGKTLLQRGITVDSVVLDKEETFYRRLYDTPFLGL